ncbi:putative enoyl-CoA hydratase echA8 [Planococcus massiliensis]|uniref:Putative enoyl-CoA hydratase echA8 n=1 Tax=Planococcus massiliensis TaxID=1499687 RepID=A0A098EHI0_9BACL|nr:enoyl-CoA hydratase-related protein [Planococcus massiliensis]CEG21723.1 putative enoyl-CoA hydratase echA8 [Planococcus massiliensis]
MEDKELIQVETEGHLAIVILANPPVNVLTDQIISELDAAIEEIAKLPDIRAVILRAAGEKAFAAGADIGQFPSLTEETGIQLVDKGKRVFDKLAASNVPVICAIQGLALGAGLELAIACDIRVVEEDAKLGLPETGLGILPGYAGTQRLSRLVGIGKAKELVLSGVLLSGQEAYEVGLAERVVPKGGAFEAAKELAEKVAAKGPVAVANAKRAINEGIELPLAEAQELESYLFSKLVGTADMQEGVKAFKEKRKPVFQGK